MKLVTAITASLILVARADYYPYQGSSSIEASTSKLIVRHSHDWATPPSFDLLKDPDSPFRSSNKSAFVELWSGAPRKRLWRRPSPALSKLWISPDGSFIVGLSKIAWNNPYQLVVFSKTGELLKAEHVTVLAAQFSKEELEAFWIENPNLKAHLKPLTTEFGGDYYVDFSFVDPERYPDAGRELYRRKTVNPIYPGASASVSNWIWWYDSKSEPSLHEQDGKLFLILQGYNGGNGNSGEGRKIKIEIPNKTRLDNPLPRQESEIESR